MSSVRQFITKIGQAGAHTLFPTEFEYYAVTLELTDSRGKSIEYLTFPVTPDNISYDDQTFVNIKKTLGGISSTDTSTNRPKRITMNGTFGRKLKLLTELNNANSGDSTKGGVFSPIQDGLQSKTRLLNLRLKSGYGVTKILKSIVDKSSSLDEYNNPLNLYLYFPVLGENYLIKINNFRLTQDITTSNMLWKYMLDITVLANLAEIRPRPTIGKNLANDVVQKGVNLVLNKVRKLI